MSEVRSPAWQLLSSLVVPGVATMRRRPLAGIGLFVLGVGLPLWIAVWALRRRHEPVALATDSRFLTAVAVVGICIVVARLLAIAEVSYALSSAPKIGVHSGVAIALAVVMAVPVLYVSATANNTRDAVAAVFDDGGDDPPLFVPEASTPAGDDSSDDSEPDDVDPTRVTNVLLLGGDAGPGRFGMRTDSMILVSIHEATGRTALVSIPRNLARLRFPPGSPMQERFPDGFNLYQGLTNAIFTYVSGQEELMEYYGADGFDPRAIALAEGLGYSLDVRIDDYALVDMQGFTRIIDAVGGVTLNLDDVVRLPPSVGDTPDVPASIGPGPVDMDGALALAYVRSRSGDSDYQRMGRQRQLLAALSSQVTVKDALSGFNEVAGALENSLRTSLSASEFSDLLDRLGDNANIGESIGLVPPLIEPGHPDWERIASIIDAEQEFVLTGLPSGYAG